MKTTCQPYRKGLEKTKFKTFHRDHNTLQLQVCYITIAILVN